MSTVPAPPTVPAWWSSVWSILKALLLLLLGGAATAGAMSARGCLPVPPAPVPIVEPTVDNPVILPDTFSAQPGRRDDITAKVFAGTSLVWIVDPSDNDALQTKPDAGTSLIIVPKVTGTFYVGALDRGGKLGAPVWCRVVAGDVPPPVPPGPVPPKPDPPSPAPIPLAGLRVLIVYESADLGKIPDAQQKVIYSKTIRDYLNAKCVMGPDSKTKEWRIYDKDVDASKDSPAFAPALARPRTAIPWIVISDGKTGFEGPLPENVDKTLALLQKFGGP